MKKTNKLIALMLVLAMLVATLAGCGEKKTPAESFFALMDEIAAVENAQVAMDMTLEMSGEELDAQSYEATLTVIQAEKGKQGVINGTVGAMGVTLTLPEITVTPEAMYLEGEATADLLSLMGLDADGSIAELIGSAAVAAEITEAEAESEHLNALTDLIYATGDKVKADLLAREGVIVEDEENKGTYILTVNGDLMLELFKIILADVIANQEAYIEAYAAYMGEDIVDTETLKEAFAELETAMAEMENQETMAELKSLFAGMNLVMKLSEGKDSYQYVIELDADMEGTVIACDISQAVTVLSEAPAIEIPTETVSIEDVAEAAVNSYYGYGDYEDEYAYEEEEMGSVEELNLTSLGNGLSEFTYYTYGGTAVKSVVPDSFEWDYAYISDELTDVSGSDADYNYYASYSSVEKEYFDLEESMSYYYSFYEDEDGTNPMTMTDVVTNGNASALAIYGSTDGYELYDVTITVDYGNGELAVISVSAYDSVTSGVADVLDYYGLELPQ